MGINKFIKGLMGLGEGFVIEKISEDESDREMSFHVRYASPYHERGESVHKLYDLSPEDPI